MNALYLTYDISFYTYLTFNE